MKTATLIMAGGKGERFWPLGRQDLPKQFLTVSGEKSLIEATIDRMKRVSAPEDIFIITGARWESHFKKHLPSFPSENIIYEPEGRDTAAAVAYGTVVIEERVGECVTVVTPADHIIQDEARFADTLVRASTIAAASETLVILGITPTRAETGYGYVHAGEVVSNENTITAYNVLSFREKPNEATARAFLAEGGYFWNSGMFIWQTRSIKRAMETYAHDIFEQGETIRRHMRTGDTAALHEAFLAMRKVPVDIGVMEKAERITCIEGTFGWDDVGSFTALERSNAHDERGNTCIGTTLALDADNCILMCDDDTLVTAVGVKDLVIIKAKDAVLVYPKGEDGAIKHVVKHLREHDEASRYL